MSLSRLLPLLFALLAAVLPAAAQTPSGQYVPVKTWASGYPNIGDIKVELGRYHDSGRYAADQRAIGSAAEKWLRDRVVAGRGKGEKLAAVFDIDETSLSNYPALKVNDYGRVFEGPCVNVTTGPCGIVAWTAAGRDAVIPPSLKLFRLARQLGVTVFFITGRPEEMRPGTEANLRRVGYEGWAQLILEPKGSHYKSAVDFKAPHRKAIEAAGYKIVLNIGDQPSDLLGGYSEATFLMPNPFYRIP